MTQDLREKIAHLKVTMPADYPIQFAGTDLADSILALIKQAGYHSREEVLEISTRCVEEGRKVERLILETKGYVKLA